VAVGDGAVAVGGVVAVGASVAVGAGTVAVGVVVAVGDGTVAVGGVVAVGASVAVGAGTVAVGAGAVAVGGVFAVGLDVGVALSPPHAATRTGAIRVSSRASPSSRFCAVILILIARQKGCQRPFRLRWVTLVLLVAETGVPCWCSVAA
jgi:hypothetical protein